MTLHETIDLSSLLGPAFCQRLRYSDGRIHVGTWRQHLMKSLLSSVGNGAMRLVYPICELRQRVTLYQRLHSQVTRVAASLYVMSLYVCWRPVRNTHIMQYACDASTPTQYRNAVMCARVIANYCPTLQLQLQKHAKRWHLRVCGDSWTFTRSSKTVH